MENCDDALDDDPSEGSESCDDALNDDASQGLQSKGRIVENVFSTIWTIASCHVKDVDDEQASSSMCFLICIDDDLDDGCLSHERCRWCTRRQPRCTFSARDTRMHGNSFQDGTVMPGEAAAYEDRDVAATRPASSSSSGSAHVSAFFQGVPLDDSWRTQKIRNRLDRIRVTKDKVMRHRLQEHSNRFLQ